MNPVKYQQLVKRAFDFSELVQDPRVISGLSTAAIGALAGGLTSDNKAAGATLGGLLGLAAGYGGGALYNTYKNNDMANTNNNLIQQLLLQDYLKRREEPKRSGMSAGTGMALGALGTGAVAAGLGALGLRQYAALGKRLAHAQQARLGLHKALKASRAGADTLRAGAETLKGKLSAAVAKGNELTNTVSQLKGNLANRENYINDLIAQSKQKTSRLSKAYRQGQEQIKGLQNRLAGETERADNWADLYNKASKRADQRRRYLVSRENYITGLLEKLKQKGASAFSKGQTKGYMTGRGVGRAQEVEKLKAAVNAAGLSWDDLMNSIKYEAPARPAGNAAARAKSTGKVGRRMTINDFRTPRTPISEPMTMSYGGFDDVNIGDLYQH